LARAVARVPERGSVMSDEKISSGTFKSHQQSEKMNIQNVRTPGRLLTAVMPDGMELRFASGLKCQHCNEDVRCHPVPGKNKNAFSVTCTECHQDVLTYDKASS
jgi:hypothetical protein